jgi:hypothetical protein
VCMLHTHTDIFIYKHYMYLHARAHIYLCTRVYTCLYTHTHTYVRMHICASQTKHHKDFLCVRNGKFYARSKICGCRNCSTRRYSECINLEEGHNTCVCAWCMCVVWCGVVRCGAVCCGVVLCGVVLCGENLLLYIRRPRKNAQVVSKDHDVTETMGWSVVEAGFVTTVGVAVQRGALPVEWQAKEAAFKKRVRESRSKSMVVAVFCGDAGDAEDVGDEQPESRMMDDFSDEEHANDDDPSFWLGEIIKFGNPLRFGVIFLHWTSALGL